MRQRNQALARRFIASVALVFLAIGLTHPALAQESTPGSAESELSSQLPPADLPTMNEQGFVFEIESRFTGSLESTPTEAPIYEMALERRDLASAQDIANKLGIEGEVTDQGGGSFAAEGNGSLYITPGLVQYISASELPDGPLPADEEAVAYAREWLRQTQLLPANIGEGAVETRVENPARVFVTFEPIEPESLLSSYPGITVVMGPNGAILEASFRWAEIRTGDVYQLREAEAAWQEVAERRAYLQATLPADTFPQGSIIAGSAEYASVSLSYTTSGVPGEAQYLQPVFVFTGELTPEGSGQSYPITAYVPALVNSQQPVG
jgi:hypothetical protein